jgi:hypothetical protein
MPKPYLLRLTIRSLDLLGTQITECLDRLEPLLALQVDLKGAAVQEQEKVQRAQVLP